MTDASTPVILGFFPPPVTGQAIATERLASLLEEQQPVQRVDLAVRAGHRTGGTFRLRPDVALHFLTQRRRWAKALAAHPRSDVLWTSVSPSSPGHLRDAAIILPALQPGNRVIGVVHHGNFDALFTRAGMAWSSRRLVQRLRGFVFLSRNLSERCASWIPSEKRWVIPNTVDEVAIASEQELARRREAQPAGGLRMLFLSNMIAEKGYADVLQAASLLRQRGLLKEAVFVGHWSDDTHRQAFCREVARLDLTAHIRHEGPIADREVTRRLFLSADAFVLPTYYPTEAQPLTILEALATGTPVITTRQGGIPEIVDDGIEAFFVPPRDPASIAEAASRLSRPDTWQRLSMAARRRFDNYFRPSVIRQQWLSLLAGTLPNA